MRRTVNWIGALALLCSVTVAAQTSKARTAGTFDHSADDQALSKLLDVAQSALNAHDAKAYAATWATDGDLRAPDGTLVKGRAQVEKYWAGLFAGAFKNVKVTIHTGERRYLGADVAIGDDSADVAGTTGTDGREIPAYTVLVTNVSVKRNGTWQTLTNRVWPLNAVPSFARRPPT